MTQTQTLKHPLRVFMSDLFSSLGLIVYDLQCGLINGSYAKDAIKDLLDSYNQERFRLLSIQLDKENLGWCTKCRALISKDEIQLLYVETTVKKDHICLRELHRVCNHCYGIFSQGKSGWDHAGLKVKVHRVIGQNESVFILAPFGWKRRKQERVSIHQCIPLVFSANDITADMDEKYSLPPRVIIDIDGGDDIHIHVDAY